MWTHVLNLLRDELGHPLLESLRLGGVRSREKRKGTLKKTKPWREERDGRRRRGKGREREKTELLVSVWLMKRGKDKVEVRNEYVRES